MRGISVVSVFQFLKRNMLPCFRTPTSVREGKVLRVSSTGTEPGEDTGRSKDRSCYIPQVSRGIQVTAMTDAPSQPNPVRPFDEERRLRAIVRLKGRSGFASPAEQLALLQGFEDRSLESIQEEAGRSTADKAQELAFQALEAEDAAQAATLAHRALDLDPRCLDARCCLAALESRSPTEQLDRLKVILAEATQALDPLLLRVHGGRLHTVPEFRPYLRSRFALASLLARMNRPKAATKAFEDLLDLDRTDPLEVRYQLILLYGPSRMTKALEALVDAFPQDTSVVMVGSRLQANVQAGQEAQARAALEVARRRNPHVEPILVGKTRMPKPSGAPPHEGSLEEAIQALRILNRTWATDRESMFWLLKAST